MFPASQERTITSKRRLLAKPGTWHGNLNHNVHVKVHAPMDIRRRQKQISRVLQGHEETFRRKQLQGKLASPTTCEGKQELSTISSSAYMQGPDTPYKITWISVMAQPLCRHMHTHSHSGKWLPRMLQGPVEHS